MSEQRRRAAFSQNDALPWWIRITRWLWKLWATLFTLVVLALVVNITSTWLTTSKGEFPKDAPLSFLLTYWPITLSVGGSLFLLATLCWAISSFRVPSRTITTQDRERMLRRFHLRYEQMLSGSLQGAVQMELGLAERPTAIHNAAILALRLPEQAEQALPPHTSIVDAYEQAQQELLILGEPGAGKSTLLLDLAHHLVRQAEQDTMQPLPVLFPLSSWANKCPPLQAWLIEQFALLYDVSRKLSQQWVETELMLPLLDGLDEMDEGARPDCIAAINTYHRDHLHPLVVCSRTTEYDNAAKHERLALHTAVVVQPLSKEQVDAHLAALGKPMAALRTTLGKNPTLAELTTTPLMLQILVLTYHGTAVRRLSQKATVLQQQIWTEYVQRMVERKGNAADYPLDLTVTWLKWLAQLMRNRNQTIFSPIDLQLAFLPQKYHSLFFVSIVLFFGLIGALVGTMVFGLIGTLVGLLFFGFYGGTMIQAATYEQKEIWLVLSPALVWMIGLLVGTPLFGNMILAWLFSWLLWYLVGLLRTWLGAIVRVLPWRAHLFTPFAAPFPEDATTRILLRRVDGGYYSFIHRLLLEYFTDLDMTKPSTSPDAHPAQQPPRP